MCRYFERLNKLIFMMCDLFANWRSISLMFPRGGVFYNQRFGIASPVK